MKYVDLNLHITPGSEGKYNVSARTDDFGGLDTEMELPVRLEELAGFVFGVAESIREAGLAGERRRPATAAPDPATQKATVRDYGAKLYSSLIHGEIQSLLDKTLGRLTDTHDVGIRIRLSMDLSSAGMADVASLPWELITKDGSSIPLVLSKQTVLVRSLSVPQPSEPAPFEPPLRILVISANPKNTRQLDLSEERRRIESTWGSLAGVHVDFAGPTYDDVRAYLVDEDPHVIHFMGHGEYDAERGGSLILEDSNGDADFVDGERLQILFGDEQRLRLVFLNACKTATDRTSDSLDPFAGVAASLIKIGVTAVVAMQFPITDEAAISFSDTFYQRIVAGDPVDTAVAEARRRLYGNKQNEWVTPVLFMRSKDGLIFEKVLAPAPEPDASTTVFLAATADSLRRYTRQIASGLEADGIKVLDPIPEPYEAAAHEEAVRAAAQSADLCVHLLGDLPGEALEEDAGRTYPLEQLRIALESARSQLVLMPEQFDINAIEDPVYREVLQSLNGRARDPQRLEFMKIGTQQMLDEVRLKVKKLKGTSAALSAACIDLHSSDLAHASDLIEYLNQREVGTLMQPSTETTPAAVMKAFISNLENAPLLLVVFGNAPREWVIGRLEWANRQILTRSLPTRIGVYVTGPDKDPDQLRFANYKIVSGVGGLNASELDDLIKEVTEQA